MNRIQRLTHHQQTVDPYLPDIRRLLEAIIPAGDKVVIVGNGALAALLIRDEEICQVDGYSTGGNGDGSSSEISRPTERAALENTDDEHRATIDFVHLRVIAAQRNLQRAADAARFLVGAIADAQRLGEKLQGRQADRHIGSGDCQACDRPCSGARDDRLRSGYCTACYWRWVRGADTSGTRPDRAYFERLTSAWDAPPERDAADG